MSERTVQMTPKARLLATATTGALLMTALLWLGHHVSGARAPSGRPPLRISESSPGSVPEIAQAAQPGKPVIFLGLDGADWQLLDRYMAAGAMPNLSLLVREGQSGILKTLNPPLSPLVWTTMMTGTGPLEHGILDFTRFNPVSGAREPITSDERRVAAIWNMAGEAGKSVAVFGLWATWPAEHVNGLMVSDRLFSFQNEEPQPPPSVVYPAEWEPKALETLKRAEREIGFDTIRAYIPRLERAEFDHLAAQRDPYAHPVSALRRILVETSVYDTLARRYLQEQHPDLTVVYIQGTDVIGHLFAQYAPPKQPEISDADFDRYGGVPEVYFRSIDNLLGAYREVARSRGAYLMIASDHGFFWGEGRPKAATSLAAATAGKWHREEGIYLIWGPDVRPGRRAGGEGVEQVCATLLHLLGMPPGRDVHGQILRGAADVPTASGEGPPPVDYNAGYHRAAADPSPAPGASERPDAADEQVEKLRALGYLGTEEPSRSKPDGAHDATRTAGSWNNEGLILEDQGNTQSAARAFERAIAIDPHSSSAQRNLSEILFEMKVDLDRSDRLLVRAAVDGLPEGGKAIIGRAIAWQRSGNGGRNESLLDSAVEVLPGASELWLYRGRYRLERKECRGALADFTTSVRLDPRSAGGWAACGLARLCLGDGPGARSDFGRSLAIDSNQPQLKQALEKTRP